MKVLSRVIFGIILSGLLFLTDGVFLRKSVHTCKIKDFFAAKSGEYDVLAFGPSYMYCTFSPPELYRRFGLRSFMIGSPCQPIYETLFFIKKALKKYHPRLVLLGADMAILTPAQYVHKSSFVHEATDGFPFCVDKLSMIFNIESDGQVDEFLFPLIKYHSRWKNLNKSDFSFTSTRNDIMGHMFYCGGNFKNSVRPYDLNTCERSPVFEDNIKWIEMTRELVEAAGAQLVLVSAPRFQGAAINRLATLHDYAAAHGLKFLDLNLNFDKTGISNTTDFYDAGHLNVLGAEKATHYIGMALIRRFDLKPCLDEASKVLWDNIVACYDKAKASALAASKKK